MKIAAAFALAAAVLLAGCEMLVLPAECARPECVPLDGGAVDLARTPVVTRGEIRAPIDPAGAEAVRALPDVDDPLRAAAR